MFKNSLYSDREGIRDYQEQAFLMYNNDYDSYVKRRMQRLIPTNYTKYSKYISPQRNILKRISSLMAIMYQRAPLRKTPDSDLAKMLQEYAPSINIVLYEVEKLLWAVGDVFIMPYWAEDMERVEYDIIPPHKVDVKIERSSVVYIEIIQVDGVRRYHRNGDVYFKSKNSEDFRKEDNALGINPIVWISLRYPTENNPWSVGEVKDLLNATVNVAILEAYRSRGNFLRSQRIPNLKNPLDVMEMLGAQAGEENALPTDQDTIMLGDFSALSLADEEDKFLDTIRGEVQDSASSRGISYNSYTKNVDSIDGVKAISEELRLRWRQGKTLFYGAERDLLKITTALINRYTPENFDVNQIWIIDYLEPLPNTDDPMVGLQVLMEGKKQGVDNTIDYLMRNNPDYTSEEEAERYFQVCLERRATEIEQMRALNQSADADMTNTGSDPEINGASGPPAVPAENNPESVQNQNKGVI